MSRLTNKLQNRANVMTVAVALTLADFLEKSNVIDIPLPVNAEVVGGSVTVDEVFNGTGTDVLDVGDSAVGNRYLNDANLEAAARSALVPTGFLTTSSNRHVRLTRVPGGSDSTQGKVRVLLQYVEYEKALFNQD